MIPKQKDDQLPLRSLLILLVLICVNGCTEIPKNKVKDSPVVASNVISQTALLILGNVQDAGSPHIACKKSCCQQGFDNPEAKRNVVSLGIIDPTYQKTYIFEATPDISRQLKMLKNTLPWEASEFPDGIFLTHAHIGHYAGLMYLGKEAANADRTPVFAMPRMKSFLMSNGPWDQLITNNNIVLNELKPNGEISLTPDIKVVPFLVPHRDEYSETVGYTIIGPNKKVLFIPDIDKWEAWSSSIIDAVSKVDLALLDATFYDATEVNNRDISEIPHPFVIETMQRFDTLPQTLKRKIRFIHFNHTNPLLDRESAPSKNVLAKGYGIAHTHDLIPL